MDASPAHARHLRPPDVAVPGDMLVFETEGYEVELDVLDVLGDGGFRAIGPRARLRDGLRVTMRAYRTAQAWRLTFEVSAVEPAAGDEACATLRLVDAHPLGDERRAARVPHAAAGWVRPHGCDTGTTTRIQTVDVSATGIAFECEHAFGPGQRLDLEFADAAGDTIEASAEVVRTGPAVYGHTRTMCRFVALEEQASRRLAHLLAEPAGELERRQAAAFVYELVRAREGREGGAPGDRHGRSPAAWLPHDRHAG